MQEYQEVEMWGQPGHWTGGILPSSMLILFPCIHSVSKQINYIFCHKNSATMLTFVFLHGGKLSPCSPHTCILLIQFVIIRLCLVLHPLAHPLPSHLCNKQLYAGIIWQHLALAIHHVSWFISWNFSGTGAPWSERQLIPLVPPVDTGEYWWVNSPSSVPKADNSEAHLHWVLSLSLHLQQVVEVPSLKIRSMIKHGLPQKDRITFWASEFRTMQTEMVKPVCTTLWSYILSRERHWP